MNLKQFSLVILWIGASVASAKSQPTWKMMAEQYCIGVLDSGMHLLENGHYNSISGALKSAEAAPDAKERNHWCDHFLIRSSGAADFFRGFTVGTQRLASKLKSQGYGFLPINPVSFFPEAQAESCRNGDFKPAHAALEEFKKQVAFNLKETRQECDKK